MIAETIAHLKLQLAGVNLISGVADFQKVADGSGAPTVTPAVYVMVTGEKARPSEIADVLIQHVDAQLGIAMVVRNVSDVTGAAAGLDMEALRAAVKAALFGWQPAEKYEQLERDQGKLLQFREGHLWWLDTYNTSYLDKAQQ